MEMDGPDRWRAELVSDKGRVGKNLQESAPAGCLFLAVEPGESLQT
jgi:hypothetical protein